MIAVEVKNIGKTYQLTSSTRKIFTAIEDVSFFITEGESVGIIGHNGAGKSTLLKLLSGISLPSSGEGKVTGTFSSLLEVGTGFHPDLSGMDNIYLNASILGVSKREVDKVLDDILAFSGVKNFIHQPLRTYSSGMKLRLAFSVIAHLKTDIIALDEVLAVGDSMFQTKCIDRIFQFKKQGRTILFVSHNLSAVKKLCERTIVLENGRLTFDGKTEDALAHYLHSSRESKDKPVSKYINSIAANADEHKAVIELQLSDLSDNSEADIGVNISTKNGDQLYHFSNRFQRKTLTPSGGQVNLELHFEHRLKPGEYRVDIYVGQNEKQLVWQEAAANLQIPPHSPYGFHNPDAIQAPLITGFEFKQS